MSSAAPKVSLGRAFEAGTRIATRLKALDCVRKVEVAGSIRRRRPWVHDIDVVVLKGDDFGGDLEIQRVAREFSVDNSLDLNGLKIKRFVAPLTLPSKDADETAQTIPVDLYITDAPNHWATLLLIRTGSAAHNIKLTSRAKARGWKLHASGEGLYNSRDGRGSLVAWESEEAVMRALDCNHFDPGSRE